MADSYTTNLNSGVPSTIPTDALNSNFNLQFPQMQGGNDLNSYFSGFSNIQSLLDKYFTSDLESQRQGKIGELESALTQYGTKASRTQAIGEQFGIPKDIEALKALNLQIAERLGQAGIDQQTQQGIGNVASTANVYSENARRKALAEVGALQAKQAALQGNIELSQKLTQQAVDVEFAPLEARITSIQEFLKLNEGQLSRADKKKADALDLILSQQKTQLDEQKAQKREVLDLSNKYLDAGILPTDSIQVAQGKALKSNSYITEQQYKEAQISNLNNKFTFTTDPLGNIIVGNTRTGEIVGGRGAVGGISGGLPGTSELVNIGNSLPFSDKFTKTNVNSQIAQKLQSGDVEGAKQYIVSQAINLAPAAAQTNITKIAQSVLNLEDIKSAINQYVAQTGDTNILKSTLESAVQKIGKTTDPNLASLKAKMDLAFFNFRNELTGAAFSDQETASYRSAFADTKNTGSLNLNKIDSLLGILHNNNQALLTPYLGGKNNYDYLFKQNNQMTPGIQKSLDSIFNQFNQSSVLPTNSQMSVPNQSMSSASPYSWSSYREGIANYKSPLDSLFSFFQ